MGSGAGLPSKPPACGHFVQFYEDDTFLCDTVASFLAAGLEEGERLFLIALPPHTRAILAALGEGRAAAALQSGQLTVIHAAEQLDALLVDGMPDAERLHAGMQRLLAPTNAFPGARVRAFGEMVNLAYSRGNVRAGLRLEELWNEATHGRDISLLCAYPLRDFSQQRDADCFEQVCRLHTHVLPTEGFARLSPAERLREVSVLQQRSRALESESRQRQAAEGALCQVLENRTRLQADLSGSQEREQEALARARASDDFKATLLGILSRDLRQPLDTILTTARLLALRGELGEDGQKRLERLTASGVRMQRMLDQVLDLARDHWANGIAVSRTPPRDLLPLVAKLVEDLRLQHPGRCLELRAERRCMASVDADRFEQVIAHLLDNAVTHGDATRPIRVTLVRRGGHVSVSVHNYGRIPPEVLPLLFDPLRKGRQARVLSAGLGLGLYISDRIVRAHGGTLRVQSSEDLGTRFEATFAIFPHESPQHGGF